MPSAMALAAGPVKRPSRRPDGEALVAQQLGEEAPVLDAQVGAVDVVLGEPGEPGQRRDRVTALGGAQPGTPGEHPRVVAGGIRLRLVEHLPQPAAAVLAVVVRDRGIRRQVERVRPVVALLVEVDRRQVEHARDEDQPVEVHAVPLLQVLGERGAAQRAVGLARDELRRHPAPVARRPQADQLGDGLDVLLVAVEVAGLAALDRARPAGRHRVDEDEVADREQRLRVVDEVVRRRLERARVTHDDPARAEQAEVQPDARAARAAVEGEGHGPLARVGAVEHVASSATARPWPGGRRTCRPCGPPRAARPVRSSPCSAAGGARPAGCGAW